MTVGNALNYHTRLYDTECNNVDSYKPILCGKEGCQGLMYVEPHPVYGDSVPHSTPRRVYVKCSKCPSWGTVLAKPRDWKSRRV